MKGTLHTDGACLGNPGPMGLGIVLRLENGATEELALPYGEGTNNIAEYSALIKGLELARKNGVDDLKAYLDSQLVVEQVNGNWQVRDANLQQLHKEATALLDAFTHVSVEHVPRAQNAKADALSKAAAEQV